MIWMLTKIVIQITTTCNPSTASPEAFVRTTTSGVCGRRFRNCATSCMIATVACPLDIGISVVALMVGVGPGAVGVQIWTVGVGPGPAVSVQILTVGIRPGGLTVSVEGEAGNGEDHDDGCKKDHDEIEVSRKMLL